VLLRGGANKEIRSTGSGALASLDLKEGQMITVGQVVGTISAAGTARLGTVIGWAMCSSPTASLTVAVEVFESACESAIKSGFPPCGLGRRAHATRIEPWHASARSAAHS